MTREHARELSIYTDAVYAQAAKLSHDLREGHLWEGDALRDLGAIQRALTQAVDKARLYDRDPNAGPRTTGDL
jgi:hypothetical protein